MDEIERRLTLVNKAKDAIDALAPEEQKVLVLRYGLEDRQSRTLEEVGQELDLTPVRIDEIEVRALRKLRHPSRNR